MDNLVFGIDLGTTYSATALMRPGAQPEILMNKERQNITPSVVYFPPVDGKDEPLVGSAAKGFAGTDPDNVCAFVKRQIGNPDWDFVSSNGTKYSAEAVDAIILKRLVADASEACGEEVKDVLITVPAYFDEPRLIATKHAAEIAGLNCIGLVNEPTAAAVAMSMGDKLDGNVMVYDLGGGTFDVTILETSGTQYNIKATKGNSKLGGFDFDNKIIQFVIDQIAEQGGPKISWTGSEIPKIREDAEAVKRALSTVTKTKIWVNIDGKPYKVDISRDDFEKISGELIQKSEDIVEIVLDDANMTWDDISHVLLVGGSTIMPMVPALIEKMRGKPADHSSVNPDEAVALGAAVVAALRKSDFSNSSAAEKNKLFIGGTAPVIHDVNSHALGVLTVKDDKLTEKNSIIIPANSTIPASFSSEIFTISDRQNRFRLQVTEGDSEDPQFVNILDSVDVPITEYPEGAPFKITYSYDVSRIIHAEVEDLTAKKQISTFEVKGTSNLSDADVMVETNKVRGLSVD